MAGGEVDGEPGAGGGAAALGAALRAARIGRGLDLEAAARLTRLGARHLAALEAGDLGALPAPPYRWAIARRYAAALGLDPEPLLARLGERQGVPPPARRRRSPVPPVAVPEPLVGALVVALAVLVALLA
jgi:cytoskeleton protein RodZ